LDVFAELMDDPRRGNSALMEVALFAACCVMEAMSAACLLFLVSAVCALLFVSSVALFVCLKRDAWHSACSIHMQLQ
jgi:hypothetical protein